MVEGLDAKAGKERQIALMRSLRTEWRLVPSTLGAGQDIVEVAGRPNFAETTDSKSLEFEVIYTRFHFDGDHWLRFERTEPGYFFNQGDFPSRDEFP